VLRGYDWTICFSGSDALVNEPTFSKWATHDDALHRVGDCGALQEVEDALRRAYERTGDSSKGRLRPSSILEGELKAAGWIKTFAWAADDLPRGTSDSFDGWKVFSDVDGTRFGVAVEVEWVWQRVMGDLLKFWRAERGGQIAVGIEVVHGPDSFDYVVGHVYALYRELISDVRVVFCALEAPDLREPFPRTNGKRRKYLMP
jgi:hypothetical protein